MQAKDAGQVDMETFQREGGQKHQHIDNQQVLNNRWQHIKTSWAILFVHDFQVYMIKLWFDDSSEFG